MPTNYDTGRYVFNSESLMIFLGMRHIKVILVGQDFVVVMKMMMMNGQDVLW